MIGIVALIATWWWTSMRAREAATQAARRACRTFDTQLLDDTVALRGLRLRRDGRGVLVLRRTYRFEFTRSGAERFNGYATLLGRQVLDVHLDAVEHERAPGRHTLH